MSDLGRKPVSEQVSQAIKPDSQKSTTERAGESMSGTYDRAASAMQPQSQKSTTQSASDTVRGGKDDAAHQSKGVVESAKDAVGSAAQSASEAVSNLTGKKE